MGEFVVLSRSHLASSATLPTARSRATTVAARSFCATSATTLPTARAGTGMSASRCTFGTARHAVAAGSLCHHGMVCIGDGDSFGVAARTSARTAPSAGFGVHVVATVALTANCTIRAVRATATGVALDTELHLSAVLAELGTVERVGVVERRVAFRRIPHQPVVRVVVDHVSEDALAVIRVLARVEDVRVPELVDGLVRHRDEVRVLDGEDEEVAIPLLGFERLDFRPALALRRGEHELHPHQREVRVAEFLHLRLNERTFRGEGMAGTGSSNRNLFQTEHGVLFCDEQVGKSNL